jgi:UDP-N-acetylglucosamine diphosphorylase / glucose-1-phosphate thymidylyltransferase / UDP-N-acetylgalactosamine diphosphorylase / glucosamine-1-phosphate N-acetyltransferase / galactosamine-1-phosphate N-acetyltransferase
MNIILFEDPVWRNQLKPLTLTRPIGDLRIGIVTIAEKWQYLIEKPVSFLTESYLKEKFQVNFEENNLYLNSSYLPTSQLLRAVEKLPINTSLVVNDSVVALHTKDKLEFAFDPKPINKIAFDGPLICIKSLPDLFLNNAAQINFDYGFITKGRVSQPINDKFTAVYGSHNIFIEEGVSIKASILNAENGPIYIGENAIIQEGSLIIGPVSIGKEATVAFGAKIRPNTTLGPVSRVGGEVGNTIFHGFSNKAHDGFMGNSYIGEWCNLGANTNNSNLKNDYKSVKLYNYNSDSLEDTGELFCGTYMGDYSKAGISTMLNTGTVIGVCANVFGSGFQEKYMPSFTWGGKTEGIENYRFDKAIEVINATMKRRNLQLTKEDLNILEYIAKQKK